MINIAIIEDEQFAVDLLKRSLLKYAEESKEDFKIYCFSDAIQFLTNYKSDYDIVFMDIELPDMDGITATKKLREMDRIALVILVTNMAQFAVDGYSIGAFDFIVKPVLYTNLVIKMNRAIQYIKNNDDVCIWVRDKQNTKRIFVSQIKYVEVMKHRIIYHTNNGDFATTGTMKMVMESLNKNSFAQCNQSYYVNLRYVESFNEKVVFVGGDELTISRPKKKTFLRALNLYLNNR